jgi:hypothetical protein
MINKIPVFGWVLSVLAAVGLSVPFWIAWTVCEIGKTYFYFIPVLFQSIPFWDCVGLFMVIAILKGTLIPRVFSVSNSQSVNKES